MNQRLAGNSISVAQWTLVSRVTGFARTTMIAAVLGATYFGNTFAATSYIPNMMFELLTGSLLASLLVPTLVRLVDQQDQRGLERVAGGFLGLAVGGFGVVAALGVLAGPLLLAALSATVSDPEIAAAQRDTGLVLLAMVMPQVVLYAIAGIGAAVMNAHGRFALAAAAPAVENVGVIVTVGLYLLLYGTGGDVQTVGTAGLLLLGLGSTVSVGLHAAAQWVGARRVGVRLVPRAGWRDPEVRALVRRAVPSVGYAAANAGRFFAATIIANGVAGGVVAFYLAQNFFYLPTAIGARPISLALLPRLSRLFHLGALVRLRDEYVRGIGHVAFVTIPAAVAYAALAQPLADAASFGALATDHGVELLSAALIGLSLGVVGEGVFVIATNAAYATDDARTPFVAMVQRTVVSLGGMLIALALVDGPALLLILGLSISAGNAVGAWHLASRVHDALPPGTERLGGPVLRASAASVVMVIPAFLVASGIAHVTSGDVGQLGALAAAALIGAAVFLGMQRALHSPELAFFSSGLRSGDGADTT